MNKKELANRIQQGFFDLAPEARSLSGYQFLRRIAVVIILIGLGAGVFGVQKKESTFVLAMDVNPSIQLELKRDYHVEKIVGLNEDGKSIIKKLQWEKNSSIEHTVELLTDKLVSEGYLKENDHRD